MLIYLLDLSNLYAIKIIKPIKFDISFSWRYLSIYIHTYDRPKTITIHEGQENQKSILIETKHFIVELIVSVSYFLL